jgi:hypothetical protein
MSMKRLWLVTVLMGACLFGVTPRAADVNVVGVWKGSMDTQMGAIENAITIQTAAPLAGTVKVGDYQAKMENASLDGEKIAFQITIEPGTVTYAGNVSGDEMKLTVTGTTGNIMSLVAKRQK